MSEENLPQHSRLYITLKRCLGQLRLDIPFHRASAWQAPDEALWCFDFEPTGDELPPTVVISGPCLLADATESCIVNPLAPDSGYGGELGEIGSLLLLPLGLDRRLGTLALGHLERRAYSQRHLLLGIQLARQVAIAFQEALEYRDLQTHYAQLGAAYHEALEKASQQLGTSKKLLEENESLQARLGDTLALVRIGQSVHMLHHVGEISRFISQALVGEMNLERGLIFLLDEQGKRLTCAAHASQIGFEGDGWTLALDDGPLGAVVHRNEPLFVGDAMNAPDLPPELWQRFPATSLIAQPLIIQGRPQGMLLAGAQFPYNKLERADMERLSILASQASQALENAWLYGELQDVNATLEQRVEQRTGELATVNEIAQVVNSSLDLRQVLDQVMAQLSRSFAVERASLLLLDEHSDQLAFAMNLGGDLEALQRFPLALGKGIAGWVAQTGQVAVVNDPESDPRFFPDVSQALGFEVASILCVPLAVKGRTIGVIQLLNKLDGRFEQADADRLLTLTPPIAIAIENARLYGEAQRQADALLALTTSLQEANGQLREVDDARIEFVSSVSHELRTPMTSIKGYTDMLLAGMTGEITEAQRRFLSIIKSNADRLGVLVDDLLELSRLEAGRIRLSPAPVSLSEVIQETVAGLQGQMVTNRLSFESALPAELPHLWGDRDRLIQIATNLLSNAIKYTPQEGSIRVTAKELAAGGDPRQIEVAISDTGIGIPPQEQHKVFQRFFRADQDAVREQVGTGLGLSIVKGLVELHGGSIWFESALGQGTAFHFTLPVATPQEGAAGEKAVPAQGKAG